MSDVAGVCRTQQVTDALTNRLNEVYGAPGQSQEYYLKLLEMDKAALKAEAQERQLADAQWQVQSRLCSRLLPSISASVCLLCRMVYANCADAVQCSLSLCVCVCVCVC